MQTAIRVQTKVQSGGKIEISDPQLPAGENVEVIILLSSPSLEDRRSVVDILADASGHRLFRTAEEVKRYIQDERGSWES